MHTFIKQRPLPDNPKKMGRVSVDDAVQCIGRFKNGALANLEATRYATGRKNRIKIEINGSDGSLEFNLEDLNRLKYFDNTAPLDRQGFADIIVTQQKGVHPYVGQWWPPGHIIGYEHTFVHTIADFVNAVAGGESVQPTFDDGLKNQQVLESVEKSAGTRRWVKV
jgi:predicted dehydrogenase